MPAARKTHIVSMAYEKVTKSNMVAFTRFIELDVVLDAQSDAITDEVRMASEALLRNVAETYLEPRKACTLYIRYDG